MHRLWHVRVRHLVRTSQLDRRRRPADVRKHHEGQLARAFVTSDSIGDFVVVVLLLLPSYIFVFFVPCHLECEQSQAPVRQQHAPLSARVPRQQPAALAAAVRIRLSQVPEAVEPGQRRLKRISQLPALA